MKNVLVTGGAGFIGSNFVNYLLRIEPGVSVVNLDKLTYAGSLENLKALPDPGRHTFVHGDICDQTLIEKTLREYQIDTIVHFAAETHVDRSILGPDRFIQTNIVGTHNLLKCARRYWFMNEAPAIQQRVRFHHISTDEVFGSLGPDEPPFSESTPYAPNSPYAASKAASDHLVRSYFHTYQFPVTITNCSNNYGPYQFLEKLLPLMISNALQGLPLPVYGDGKQIRDWLYVEDHCQAIWTVLKRGQPGETYNVGGDNQPINLTVIETLCDILDELRPASKHIPHRSLIQHVPDRPGHDRRYAMDISKIKRELGWQPKHSLDEGLMKTVSWYLEHTDWVEQIRSQGDYQSWIEKNYQKRGDFS